MSLFWKTCLDYGEFDKIVKPELQSQYDHGGKPGFCQCLNTMTELWDSLKLSFRAQG